MADQWQIVEGSGQKVQKTKAKRGS